MAAASATSAEVLNPRNLKLPFWLFNFEEIVDVFFRGRPGVEEEVEILSEVIPLAKGMYRQSGAAGRPADVKKYDPKTPATRSTRRCPTGWPTSSP